MMEDYIPEKEIPDFFWNFIYRVNGDIMKIRTELNKLDKSEIYELFMIFLDAKTEMTDVISARYEEMEITEDTIDDLSDSIITKGKDEYLNFFYERKKQLPSRNIWENLNTIGYLFSEVYYNRFNENIYDTGDEE